MANAQNTASCSQCGGNNVEQRKEGLYCISCNKIVKMARTVHHEGFPHVVVDENEQEP